MKHPLPPRPELGSREGLAYALFLPPEEPRAGVVICHGSGSAKESHFDFARNAMAHGIAALSFDTRAAAASLSDAGTALLLMHAQGDEQVPYTVSQEMHAAAGEPKRLLIMPGGHHRSLQHDLEMQAESIRFIEQAAARRAGAT